MKTISIKKLSAELQQYIIKEVAGAKGINYEGESMSSKPPKWFEMFYKEFVEFKININNRLDKIEQRLDVLESKMDLLFSLPTIKKELKELDS